MKRSLGLVGAVILVLVTSGCAMTFDSTHLGVPVTMAGSPGAAPAGTPFKVTRHPVYILYGLVTAGAPNLEDALEGQLGAGAAVQNLKIRVGMGPTDVLFTLLTIGIFSPRTVTFEGEIAGGNPGP